MVSDKQTLGYVIWRRRYSFLDLSKRDTERLSQARINDLGNNGNLIQAERIPAGKSIDFLTDVRASNFHHSTRQLTTHIFTEQHLCLL